MFVTATANSLFVKCSTQSDNKYAAFVGGLLKRREERIPREKGVKWKVCTFASITSFTVISLRILPHLITISLHLK